MTHVHIHKKCHTPSSSGSLAIAIKRKTEYTHIYASCGSHVGTDSI